MSNDCREPVSERVVEKNRANFCDWFSAAPDARADKDGDSGRDDARKAFDSLFSDD